MEKYGEPQIFIANNKEISDRLSAHYNIATGNLGVNKLVKFRELENKSYVNLEYNIVDNLHEYSVVIIDLQIKVHLSIILVVINQIVLFYMNYSILKKNFFLRL